MRVKLINQTNFNAALPNIALPIQSASVVFINVNLFLIYHPAPPFSKGICEHLKLSKRWPIEPKGKPNIGSVKCKKETPYLATHKFLDVSMR